MKNYTITVNGTAYDVTVEENNGAAGAQGTFVERAAARLQQVQAAAAAAPAPQPAKQAVGTKGQVQVVSPMPGKILGVKVRVGDAVKKGQVLMILEAMKMENEIPAPQDGTVASIEVSEGASVDPGALLATLN